MRGLCVAIGFLTRIPLPPRAADDADAQRRSLAWYPLVGALLGLLLVLIQHGLNGAPPLPRAALLLAAWIALTGALHLDGLADSADAWIGGLGDRDRTLAIMKDPRCGPAGVVALVLVLLLKFSALASLPPSAWPALLLTPLLARAALVLAFVSTAYVRGDGLGSALVAAPRGACHASLACSILACALHGWNGAIALAAAAVVFALWRRACRQRLGGMTGDTLGALVELTEAAVLIALVVCA